VETRKCTQCPAVRARSEFVKKSGKCRDCRQKYSARYYSTHKEKWERAEAKARAEDLEAYRAANRAKQATYRASPTNTIRLRYLKRRHGITIEQYVAMETAQGGVCAICREPGRGSDRRLHVDHCHATGRVRGLLCFSCNVALGAMSDRTDWLEAASAYLKK
jgi:hypothetical protein